MKYLCLASLLLVSGCAIVDEPAPTTSRPFEAATQTVNLETTDHGLLTVTDVRPRSDIAILPPSVQHVVWRVEKQPVVYETIVPKKDDVETVPTAERRKTPTPRETWPLLAEDLDFESKIGDIAMCDPEGRQTSGPLIPCENPEQYECYATKIGEYCLEAIR